MSIPQRPSPRRAGNPGQTGWQLHYRAGDTAPLPLSTRPADPHLYFEHVHAESNAEVLWNPRAGDEMLGSAQDGSQLRRDPFVASSNI